MKNGGRGFGSALFFCSSACCGCGGNGTQDIAPFGAPVGVAVKKWWRGRPPPCGPLRGSGPWLARPPARAIGFSGVPAANGGARLRGRLRGSLPCSRRRRPVFGRGVGGGGVSFRSGVARSPVRGAVFAPGGRVAAGRGRVPPYGPQAGLGRNASPPGVPPSPVGGKRCGRWPRFEFAPADAGAGRARKKS